MAAVAALLGFVEAAQAADVTLAWDPPVENEDGTPLTDLTWFKVYAGAESRQHGKG